MTDSSIISRDFWHAGVDKSRVSLVEWAKVVQSFRRPGDYPVNDRVGSHLGAGETASQIDLTTERDKFIVPAVAQ